MKFAEVAGVIMECGAQPLLNVRKRADMSIATGQGLLGAWWPDVWYIVRACH